MLSNKFSLVSHQALLNECAHCFLLASMGVMVLTFFDRYCNSPYMRYLLHYLQRGKVQSAYRPEPLQVFLPHVAGSSEGRKFP